MSEGRTFRDEDTQDYKPGGAVEILSYDQMIALPDPDWLIKDVLPARASSVIFGRSNAYKSFVALDMGCSVGTKTDWHGHKIRHSGPVIYAASEGALGIAKLRIPGWMDHYGIPPESRRNIFMVRQELILRSDGNKREFVESIDNCLGGPPALIIFDLLTATLRGAPSDGEVISDWKMVGQELIRELDCSLLWVTHSGWSDDSRTLGHTDLWGGFDTRLKATGDQDRMVTEIEVERHKDSEGGQSYTFRLDPVPVGDGLRSTLVPVLDADAEVRKRKKKRGPVQTIVLEAFDELVITGKTTQLPPSFKLPAGTRAVRYDDLLAEFKKRTPKDEGRDRRAEQLKNALSGLREELTYRDHYVWRVC